MQHNKIALCKKMIGLTPLAQHLMHILPMSYQGVRINVYLLPDFNYNDNILFMSIKIVLLKFILFNVVCDTGVSIPNKPPTNQSKNNLYECYVCNVPCNSEFMYEQHVQGAKHRKKVSLREVNIHFT